MMIKYVTIIGLIAILTIFSGCRGRGATMPEAERNFGKSFEAAKQNQTINPEASKNTSPVIGLDGKAAEAAVGKYEKSFGEGQKKETYNLNLRNMSKVGNSK